MKEALICIKQEFREQFEQMTTEFYENYFKNGNKMIEIMGNGKS